MAIYKNGELSAMENTQMEGDDTLLNYNGTDSVNRFIATKGIGTREKSTTLYNSYKDYCYNHKEEAKSRQEFFKALRKSGFAKRIVHGTHYYERQFDTSKETVATNIQNDSADGWTDDSRLLNKTIEDYIVTASKAVALLEAIADIANTYGIDNDSKTAVIKIITSEYERKE